MIYSLKSINTEIALHNPPKPAPISTILSTGVIRDEIKLFMYFQQLKLT